MAKRSSLLVFLAITILLLCAGRGRANEPPAGASPPAPTFFGADMAAAPETAAVRSAPAGYRLTAPTLPAIEVERAPGDLGEGYLFLSLFSFDLAPASTLLILDDDGEPVFYDQDNFYRADFKKLPSGRLAFTTMAGPCPTTPSWATNTSHRATIGPCPIPSAVKRTTSIPTTWNSWKTAVSGSSFTTRASWT